MTPLMIPKRRKYYDAMPKMPWQDAFRFRPGYMGKVGISGALEQPARYATDYAIRRYGPEAKLKGKHLYWYYRRKYIAKYIKYWHPKYSNYALPKTSKTKRPTKYNKNIQKGAKLRTGKSWCWSKGKF